MATRRTYADLKNNVYAENSVGAISATDLQDLVETVEPYQAATDPTANDDGANTSTNGTFEVGSVWRNTSDNGLWLCASNATGAAVWLEVGSGGGGASTLEGPVESLTWSTATQSLDWDTSPRKNIDISTNVTTLSFSNTPASGTQGYMELHLKQDATAGWSITFPAAVTWVQGEAPDLVNTSPNETVLIVFWVRDGGTTIYGSHNKLSYEEIFEFALSDETSDLTTGTKLTWRAKYAMEVTDVRASVSTAPVGANVAVDINEGGVSIFSTTLSIDAGEKTSTTAATGAVISDGNLADDAEITFDIDQVGSTTAGAGLKVALYVRRQ